MSEGYEVQIALPVIEDLASMTGGVQYRFFKAVDLIQRFPELGHDYVAEPDEDDLPFPCREYHMPDTSKTIYYTIDCAQCLVKVFALLDQRLNPANRFRGVDESGFEGV